MKTPKTLHIEGSGTSEKDTVKLSSLENKFIIIEEKIDGTDVNISFDNNANISIQTRNHIANAKQFSYLHKWVNENVNKLWDLLSDRYVMYGMYCYAKHTIFYNNLCHYFLESDIYDRKENQFLSTYRRQELISKHCSDLICSVPIIKLGRISSRENLKSYIMPSLYKTDMWKHDLKFYCMKYHYDYDKIMQQTEDSLLMEGLYIKHESKDNVIGRYKYIRHHFLQTILKSGSHFADRAVIPNIVNER